MGCAYLYDTTKCYSNVELKNATLPQKKKKINKLLELLLLLLFKQTNNLHIQFGKNLNK